MKRNVLIIEDEKACRNALAEMTQKCDAAGAVFCAGNSSEAYKYAMEKEIDLFLIDIMLDENNVKDLAGIVFAENIRTMERYSFTPIIFITSLVDQQMNAFHRLHCFDYLEKPFDPLHAQELIKKALKMPVVEDRAREVLYYKKDSILFTLVVDEIKYIESHLRKITAHMADGNVDVPYYPNRTFMKDLPRKYFVQCNRNISLNRKYIEHVDKANLFVKIRGDRQVKIGGKMKKSFFDDLGI